MFLQEKQVESSELSVILDPLADKETVLNSSEEQHKRLHNSARGMDNSTFSGDILMLAASKWT